MFQAEDIFKKQLEDKAKDHIEITLVIENNEVYGPQCRGKLKQKQDENGNFVFNEYNTPVFTTYDTLTEKIETRQDFMDILAFSVVQNKLNKFLNEKFLERVKKGESFYAGDIVKENIDTVVDTFIDNGFLPVRVLTSIDVDNPENVISACVFVGASKEDKEKYIAEHSGNEPKHYEHLI